MSYLKVTLLLLGIPVGLSIVAAGILIYAMQGGGNTAQTVYFAEQSLDKLSIQKVSDVLQAELNVTCRQTDENGRCTYWLNNTEGVSREISVEMRARNENMRFIINTSPGSVFLFSPRLRRVHKVAEELLSSSLADNIKSAERKFSWMGKDTVTILH